MRCIVLSLFLLAGCGPTVINMGDGLYRVKDCQGMECSRMRHQVCPNGYQILNPDFMEERGAIISCYKE